MDMDDEEDSFPILQFPKLPETENGIDYHDWDYTMRREMQEILPGVFLGPYAVATKKMLPYLQKNHITHIVCIRHPMEARIIRANFSGTMQYLEIDLDENMATIVPHIPRVKRFIDSCLETKGCVLVHGNAGISSSATFVIAYIMETYGLRFENAYKLVQKKRFCVNPSDGFRRQLMDFEAICLAKCQTLPGASQDAKRKRDDDDDDDDDEMNPEFPNKATKKIFN